MCIRDSTDPVLHMVVSWPEFERPSNDEIFWAGRRLLKALNLHEHQSIMAIHGDTDNIHVHIEVNRVDVYKRQVPYSSSEPSPASPATSSISRSGMRLTRM